MKVTETMTNLIPWLSSYASLPESFYQSLGPTQFQEIQLLFWNQELSVSLGIPFLTDDERAKIFSGVFVDSKQKPVAQAYSGHQFGYFNPNMGDGRAMLLGELKGKDGLLYDVHLKGSGPTKYSRRGDGRANFTACIKEILVSEHMHALGVPSSRSLAMVATGEQVMRQTLEPGAVLARVAKHHIRVGTFEYFSSRKDVEGLRVLMDFLMSRDYPTLQNRDEESFLEVLNQIVQKQAKLLAQWTSLGFVHGVMNTDNCFLSGETLDYGPCAFMESYNPTVVFSSIDHEGRYAFDKQPTIAQWNLSKFALSLRPLLSGRQEEVTLKLTKVLEQFGPLFEKYQLEFMGKKFGFDKATEEDLPLMQDFLKRMYLEKVDYTLGFRWLAQILDASLVKEIPEFFKGATQESWIEAWKKRLSQDSWDAKLWIQKLSKANPVIVARNSFVERAIERALQGEWDYFNNLLLCLKSPFERIPGQSETFYNPVSNGNNEFVTYCNT